MLRPSVLSWCRAAGLQRWRRPSGRGAVGEQSGCDCRVHLGCRAVGHQGGRDGGVHLRGRAVRHQGRGDGAVGFSAGVVPAQRRQHPAFGGLGCQQDVRFGLAVAVASQTQREVVVLQADAQRPLTWRLRRVLAAGPM